jgi:phosphoribosylglycinamide formyltransferase-1
MAKLNLAILISGRGSNMAALIDAAECDAFPARIGLVVSNVADAAGLVRARAAGIRTETIDHRQFTSRESFEDALTATLAAEGVDLVCLAGFMRLLTPHFVNRWQDRVINIHPSLLPAFRGLHVHERVLAAGVRFTGCTVHFVRPAMDDGPIIVQAAVPVQANDDAGALAARVLASEHQIYPLAIRLIAEGRVHLKGERVVIDGAAAPRDALLNPLPM